MMILKGFAGKRARIQRKTPIWRFIPQNPLDEAEVAFPGATRTFTHL